MAKDKAERVKDIEESELVKAVRRLEERSEQAARELATTNLRLQQALVLLRPNDTPPRKLADVNRSNLKALHEGVLKLVARYEETTGIRVTFIRYDPNEAMEINLGA